MLTPFLSIHLKGQSHSISNSFLSIVVYTLFYQKQNISSFKHFPKIIHFRANSLFTNPTFVWAHDGNINKRQFINSIK